MKTSAFLSWPAFIRVILFWLATMACFALASSIFKNSMTAVSVAIFVAVLLTLLFVRWQKMKLTDTGIIPVKNTYSKFLWGVVIGCVLATIQASSVLFTRHFRIVINEIHGPIISNLGLYFLLSCREELVFRGFPLRALQLKSGIAWALVSTSVCFIIEHIIGGMSWWPAIWGTGLGALVFGMAAIISRGLSFPIGIHFAWNAMQWTLGFKNNEGIFRTAIDKGYEAKVETIASIVYVFLMCLTAIISLYYYKQKQRKKPTNTRSL